jgi:replicative DNA helicase
MIDALKPLDAERSVLAAMMLDESPIAHAVESIDATAFHLAAHAKAFGALAALSEKRVPADLITVAEELNQRGDLEAWADRRS